MIYSKAVVYNLRKITFDDLRGNYKIEHKKTSFFLFFLTFSIQSFNCVSSLKSFIFPNLGNPRKTFPAQTN